jgi:hypothetical protein
MERSTIQYGQGVEQLDTEMKHLRERSKWADQDFAKETRRVEQRRKWADTDFTKELGRIEIRREWLDEDLQRTLNRLSEQAGFEEAQRALRIKQFEEDMQMSKTTHDENLKYAMTMNGIQAQQLAENKRQWAENFAQQVKEQAAAYQNWLTITRLQDALAVSTGLAQIQMDNYTKDLGDPNGAMAKAMTAFVANWNTKMIGPTDSMDKAARTLVDNFAAYVRQVSASLFN